MSHLSRNLSIFGLLIFALTAPGLQPAAEAIVCDVKAERTFVNSLGRVVLMARTVNTEVFHPWNLCDLERVGPVITQKVCSTYFTMFLTAGATGAPLKLHFNDDVLGQKVADRGFTWDGTCEGIVNWTVIEPALTTVEINFK